MTKRFSTLLSTILIFSILQIGCEDDPPIPPDNKPPLGKRDYSWTMDTIAYPNNFQTTMFGIYGSSPNDVYVVGHSDGSSAATMFRYDGVKWNTTKFHVNEGGPISGPIDLTGVFVFSLTDVWAVGDKIFEYPINSGQYIDSSIIIHYNGINWHEHKVEGGRGLLTVWGTDSNKVWVGGLYGSLFKKVGSQFSKQYYNANFSVKEFSGTDYNNLYLLSYWLSSQQSTIHSLLEKYDGNSWLIIDSTQAFPAQNKFGEGGLFVSKSGRVFTSGVGGVYELDSNGWKKLLDTGVEIIINLFNTADNNMFAVGRGMVYHYNGEDWFKYEQFSNQEITWNGVWTDGYEVFIIGYTFGGAKTIVIHGK